jgi:hypothetical protein
VTFEHDAKVAQRARNLVKAILRDFSILKFCVSAFSIRPSAGREFRTHMKNSGLRIENEPTAQIVRPLRGLGRTS